MSFRWMHMSEGTFSHIAAHVIEWIVDAYEQSLENGPRQAECVFEHVQNARI